MGASRPISLTRSAVESAARLPGAAGGAVAAAVAFRLALRDFRYLLAGFRLCHAAFTGDAATSAMSQRGHLPGADDVTSACIGQTYLAAAAGVCARTISTEASPKQRVSINKRNARNMLNSLGVFDEPGQEIDRIYMMSRIKNR